jgi:hypothetical protein
MKLLITNDVEKSTQPRSQCQFLGVGCIGFDLVREIDVPVVMVISIHILDYTCYLCGYLDSIFRMLLWTAVQNPISSSR